MDFLSIYPLPVPLLLPPDTLCSSGSATPVSVLISSPLYNFDHCLIFQFSVLIAIIFPAGYFRKIEMESLYHSHLKTARLLISHFPENCSDHTARAILLLVGVFTAHSNHTELPSPSMYRKVLCLQDIHFSMAA